MRILLVRPPNPRFTMGLKHLMACEPLELEYVAAGLTLHGHDVQILDLQLERGLRQRLRTFKPSVVGTSCYITGVNEAIRICRAVRRHDPSCLTVVGGVHAGVVPRDLADPSVDCIALCDGTTSMPEIVAAWAEGRTLEEVPGLALPKDGTLQRTAPRPYLVDPDRLPKPRRDLVAHLRHRYHYLHFQPVALLKTTWGCPHRCQFCFARQITGGSTWSRSPESIADELETIECDDIYVVDDNFFHHRERLAALAALLRKRGIRKHYMVYGRADFIANNEDVIHEWAALGLSTVLVGLEAPTDEGLASLGKSTKAEHNTEAIRILQRHLIDIQALFIVSPEYGPEDWERVERFIREQNLYYINLSALTPYPGTDLWQSRQAEAVLDRQAHPLWDMAHVALPSQQSLRDYYRTGLGVYARTLFNPLRAMRSAQWQPPPWSPAFWRILRGLSASALQLTMAHHHHAGWAQRLAGYRGRLPRVTSAHEQLRSAP